MTEKMKWNTDAEMSMMGYPVAVESEEHLHHMVGYILWTLKSDLYENRPESLEERTNEIGIRKAIGAKSRSILASIVVESMIITTIFGYIGMWLGMVVAEVSGNIISKVQEGNAVSINIMPSIDIRIVLLATALLIVCGVLAGFFPARNAVKIKPIEAMNYR